MFLVFFISIKTDQTQTSGEEIIMIAATPLTQQIEIPCQTDLHNKTYMDYRKITNKDSLQYKYIHSNQITVDSRGFLVTEDNYIGVAMGSYFGSIGDKFIITLDNGNTIRVVKVEAKADNHTCQHNVIAGSNDLLEFVIDTESQFMQNNIQENGLVFNGNFNNFKEFNGNITKVEKVIEGCWIITDEGMQRISDSPNIQLIT